MTITNLTNTTWVFKSGEYLNFYTWGSRSWSINFISNSTSYIQLDYVYYEDQSEETDMMQYYSFDTHSTVTVYKYDWRTEDITWTNVNYRTIQITSGEDVHDSDLIKFLSNNAICQTPLVTVTFNMNGIGSSVSSQTFAKGTKANMPIPSDDGYIFAGWYTDSSLTTRFNFNMSILSNTTFYAKWIPKAIKTKVSGAWNSGTPLVKANNTWKDIDKMFVKVDGVWQPVIDNEQPSPVKCAEFSTASDNYLNNSNFFVSKYGNASWLSFKILTNNSFSFNIGIYFDDEANW